MRFATLRFDPLRFALLRSAPLRFATLRFGSKPELFHLHSFQAATPLLK
jgi:hypothetical protein